MVLPDLPKHRRKVEKEIDIPEAAVPFFVEKDFVLLFQEHNEDRSD